MSRRRAVCGTVTVGGGPCQNGPGCTVNHHTVPGGPAAAMTAAVAGAGPDPFAARPPAAGARAASLDDVLDRLTDEAKGDAGCRGNLFEPVAVEWLRRVPDGTPLGEFAGGRGGDPPIRGDISAVYSWDEFTSGFPGRVSDEDDDGGDDTDNGIDAIAEMKDGALIAIQIKTGDRVLSKKDIDSFVSCSKADPGGVRRYAYQVLIYTNPYVNKRGRNLLKSHHDMLVIPFDRLDDAEPEGGWQELLDDTAAERSKVARPKPKSSEEGDGASTSAKRTPPKRRTWEQTINRPARRSRLVGRSDQATLARGSIQNRPSGSQATMPQELQDADWLTWRYTTEKATDAAIAAELGCSAKMVREALRGHGIKPRSAGFPTRYPQLHDEAWLRDQYENQHRPVDDIAAELGCAASTVRGALRGHGIKTRPGGRRRRPELDDPVWLRDQYETKQLSIDSIAAELGCSLAVADRALATHNLMSPRRAQNAIDRLGLLGDGDGGGDGGGWLRDQYENQHRSVDSIAGELGCRRETVRKSLTRYGIPIRPVDHDPMVDSLGG